MVSAPIQIPIEINGYWFEEGDSTRTDATLTFSISGFQLQTGGSVIRSGQLSELQVSNRVGNIPRKIYWPDRSLFESSENDTIDRALLTHGNIQGQKSNKGMLIHRLESSMIWVAFALVFSVLIAGAFFKWGLPYAASQVAMATPPAVGEKISTGALATMDRLFFEPTELETVKQEKWQQRFDSLVTRIPSEDFTFKLHFRQLDGMPNALALPSGDIVVTDAFLKLVEPEEEFDAVILHEIGHVVERHGLQQVLQASTLSLIISLAIGEVSGLGEIIAGVPVFLMQSSYSRKAESSADDYAFSTMSNINIDPAHFASIIRKLGASGNPAASQDDEEALPEKGPLDDKNESGKNKPAKENDRGEENFPDYLASHPATEKRALRALEMSRIFRERLE